MTISYSLAPNPKWYIADLTGKPLGGGYLATFSNLDNTLLNPVFQDEAGTQVWPYVTIPNVGSQGILFDENGAQGPFYFKFDTSQPDQLYYLEVYDADGVLQWTIDNFIPPSGGGGSIITTSNDLENLIINNVLWRNLGGTAIATAEFLKIAPSAHAGFCNNVSNAAGLYTGPDICFIKNNTNATDTLSFIKFNLGEAPLTGDTTPVYYLRYVCSNEPVDETIKCVQFPITTAVHNLSNQNVTATIWARCNGGDPDLTLQFFQFFGDGAGASAPVTGSIQTLSLTPTWQKYVVSATVPNVSAKTLGAMGATGNDALFLQVAYPLSAITSIDFIKPGIYLGNVAPDEDFSSNDMIDSLINSPHTGDTRTAINNFWPFGWVVMNDGTIGSASSTASTRANTDTFCLYNNIWNSISNTWAPVVGGRGADAVTDFLANKPIFLPRALGRVFAGTLNTEITSTFTVDTGVSTSLLNLASTTNFQTGVPIVLTTSGSLPTGLAIDTTYYVINVSATTIRLANTFEKAIANIFVTFSTNGTGVQTIQVTPYALGTAIGEELHALTISEMPSHDHPGTSTLTGSNNDSGDGFPEFQGDNDQTATSTITLPSQGGGLGHNTIQPTTYMNVFIKL